MARSEKLHARDWRAIFRVVGECRELGDDRVAWRTHLLAEASRLTGSDLGMTAEMAGCRDLRPVDLGMVTWGWQTGFVGSEVFDLHVQAFRHDPNYLPMMIEGMRRRADRKAVTFRRSDVVVDRDWYRSTDYQFVFRGYGVDSVIYGLRTIPGSGGACEDLGVSLARAQGRPDYDGRERAIVSELVAALTPLTGGPLARFDEPSPLDLPPRARAVLACLLEGDGDKQIAARLGISVYTVNQYTKTILRHFGANGRSELLARWVRRGWGRLAWREPLEAAPATPPEIDAGRGRRRGIATK